MSIKGHDDEEIVRLPGFWSLAVKVAIALSLPATLSVVSLLTWVVVKTFDHDTRLAVLEDRARSTHAAGNTNTNIITSDAAQMAEESKSGRTYLTTAEVAKRESKADHSVSERTVVDWIASGRIVPAPVKDGAQWRIAAKYRIPPQTAALGGTGEGGPN